MNELLILWQFLFAAFVGYSAFWLIRRASDRTSQMDLQALKRRIADWPSPAPRLWMLFLLVLPVADRWSKPSAGLAKKLAAVGGHPNLVDREFAVFRSAVSLLTASLAAILLSVASLFSTQSLVSILLPALLLGCLAYLLVSSRISDRYKIIQRQVVRSFPNFLDVLSLTLESGKNFQSALQMSAQQLSTQGASAGLRTQLLELIRDIRASGSRTLALQRFSDRLALPEVVQFTAAVIAADRQGVSVSALLRRQAEQLRTSHALAAERHAMKLPVKLLAPLAICIFPCTFLILAFPLAVRLSGSGLF
jgi:tight adherence protein C